MTRFVCIALLLGSMSSALADPATETLDEVNRVRAAAGLGRVELDPALSAGCMKHTEYLRLNEARGALVGLRGHHEQADLPGATPEGAACGEASDLAYDEADIAMAVSRGWIAGIYHRRPLLDPTLATIGVGYSQRTNGKYIEALRFGAFDATRGTWPVRYPADRQVDVPFEFLGETPNPAPTMPAGYPITLQFPPFDKITDVHAKLTDGKGLEIAAYVTDPVHRATWFPQQGIVALIAKHPLAPDTTYLVAVEATWRGKHETWAWQFKTVGLRLVDASNPGSLTAALGKPSRVHGKVSHAGTIDHGHTVWLQLGKSEPMLSVIMPLSVWRELAGQAEPRSWEGRTLAVQSTPERVGSKFINLGISAADQLQR